MKTTKNRRIEKEIVEKKYQYYENEKTPLYCIIVLFAGTVVLTLGAIFFYKINKNIVEIFASIMLGILAIAFFILAVTFSFYNIKAKIWTRRYEKMKRLND